MKKTIISYFIFIFCFSAFAVIQTSWEQTYGGSESDACEAFCIAADGGCLMAGYTNSFGADWSDIYLVKTDDEGNEEWNQTIGCNGWQITKSVCTSQNNNGYVITGYTTENGNFDIFSLKIDLNGNQIWYQTYGGDQFDTAESICKTSDGAYFLLGFTASFGLGEDDIFLVKIDDSGNVIWQETYGCANSDTGHCIKAISDGNYLICGSTGLYDIPIPGSNGRNREIDLLKIDVDGNILAENTYWTMGTHQNDYDVGFDVCETSDGGFCLVGHASQHLNELMDIALVKVDSDLNEIWKTNLEFEAYYDFGYSIIEDVNSTNLLLCGSFKYTNIRLSNMCLFILDADGNEIARAGFGSSIGSECGNQILQKDDGSIVIAGYSSSSGSGNNDAWLIELVSLNAAFDADLKSGHAPLEIQFEDQSSGMIDTWEWDFNNDGIIDSNDQNPLWVFQDAGYYDVKLKVSYQGVDHEMLKEDYIRVFNGYSALEFEGTDSNLIIPAIEIQDITDAFTFEAWIYPSDYGPDTNFGLGRIFDKSAISVFLNNEFPLYDNQSLILQMQHADGTISLCSTPATSIGLNDWIHIAASYNGIDETALYVNGISMLFSQPTAPSGALETNADQDLFVGNMADLSKSFVGVIDEVRIWNRFRTQSEVQSDMNEYLNGYESGLISYCKLDEGFGNTAFDEVVGFECPFADTRWAQGIVLDPAESEEVIIPVKYHCSAYPNPFNPETTINFRINPKTTEHIELNIYNLKGQKVKTLVNDMLSAGQHSVIWNGTDNFENPVASGVYFYRLQTPTYYKVNKMLMLK